VAVQPPHVLGRRCGHPLGRGGPRATPEVAGVTSGGGSQASSGVAAATPFLSPFFFFKYIDFNIFY
jgi:hypothetical protein